jgi:hypothetical protein
MLIKIFDNRPDAVALAHNFSYSEGRDQDNGNSMQAQANIWETPISTNKSWV